MRLLILPLVLLFAGELPPDGAETAAPANEKSLTLKPGQSAAAPGGARVTFVKVLGDSRCPRGVECFWAGNARIALSVQPENGAATEIELNTSLAPREQQVAGSIYRLAELKPYPQHPDPIAAEEYEAVLGVRAAD